MELLFHQARLARLRLEMLLMGTLAAAVAYAVGALGAVVLGNADL